MKNDEAQWMGKAQRRADIKAAAEARDPLEQKLKGIRHRRGERPEWNTLLAKHQEPKKKPRPKTRIASSDDFRLLRRSEDRFLQDDSLSAAASRIMGERS